MRKATNMLCMFCTNETYKQMVILFGLQVELFLLKKSLHKLKK
jgi:hypothetical protein